MRDFWQNIHDRNRWPKFLRRVNVSFHRLRRGEVLTFLLFLAIAIFFWIVQTAREETVQDFIVDVYVTDQPQDMVFTTHVPKQLRVSLSDTNIRLLNDRINHRLESVSIDFERYADAVGNYRVSAAELQSLLAGQLPNTTRIVAVNPSLIDARFAQTEGRRFPVKVMAEYMPADNHRLHAIRIEPDSVIINAPTSVLDTLRYVYAIDSTRHDLRDTLIQHLNLDLPIGVKATPSQVRVTIPVVEYVEKVFPQIELQVTDVPRGRTMVVFPYAVQITCLVDFSSYRSITADMFKATVSYNQLSSTDDQAQGFLPITVTYDGPAEAVTAIHAQPARAEYVIQ